MSRLLWTALGALGGICVAPSASAQELHWTAGIGVGYLIAGDSAIRGHKANPTGGAAIMPFGRVALEVPHLPNLEAVYTQAPLVVTPYSLDRTGLIDANDLGLAYRFRSYTVGLSGTIAPTYARFCNVRWCLKEATLLRGGEAHVIGGKDGLHVDFAARLLYAQPTAWTWPGLSVEDRAIVPTIFTLTGAAGYSW